MARNINARLGNLRIRRRGLDRLTRLAEDAQYDVLAKSIQDEPWQKRAATQPYTRYALGAMQEVESDYTRISIETAQRVGKKLAASISNVEFELQGSVPLNVHIRGVSDVDLLILATDLVVYDGAGPVATTGGYSPSPKTSSGVLANLRADVEKVLPIGYPSATVDVSGGKAVKIFGGSLPREVDVVPSHWYDTADYQRTGRQSDRGVYIYNKKTGERPRNYPFKHIQLVDERCKTAFGGLRKAIRLCKNVKSDADSEGTSIPFPGFDIAATMYHADVQALQFGYLYELRILAEAQRFLDVLYHNETFAKSLGVPDGSRVIFDTQEKYEGLKKLSVEMDDLLREVAKEQSPILKYESEPLSLQRCRDTVSSLHVA